MIRPHRIIALTPTTRVRHFRLVRAGRGERVAVWRGFRLVHSFSC